MLFQLFFAHTLRPNQISNMGGVITIWGKDFAADNFNQFEPDLGNKVINSSILDKGVTRPGDGCMGSMVCWEG